MARTTIRSEDITAGQVKAADLASDATSGIQTDIAILGFKVAANGSLAKYNLVDQTIDDFQDTSGVDASASTGEFRDSAGKYYSGADVTAPAWFEDDRNSGDDIITVSTDMSWYDTAPELDIQALVNGNETYSAAGGSWFSAGGNGYIRFDHGAGNSYVYTNSRWYYGHSNPANEGTWKWQGSNDASSWTDIGGTWILTATGVADDVVRMDEHSAMTANTTAYRYYQCVHVSGNNTHGGGRRIEMNFYGNVPDVYGNMTLVSNSTTAEAVPTKGDLVMTYTNGAGTATVNTDIKGWVSRDNGSNYTQFTLADEGDTGGHTILTAHDLDISGQPSGTSMRYKITTHNQSAAKETRIQAVSLGWS